MRFDTPGPSAPPPTPALSAARTRVAETLRDLGPQATLATLAAHLGGHPNSTRAHLDGLVDDGLAVRTPLPTTGPGRPAHGWSLSELGRRALAGNPAPPAYAQLTMILAGHLAELGDGAATAERLGRAWGESQGRTSSIEELVETLGELGFSPERTRTGIRLRTCPLLKAARENESVICSIHAGLIRGSTGREDLALEPFSEPGACTVTIPA